MASLANGDARDVVNSSTWEQGVGKKMSKDKINHMTKENTDFAERSEKLKIPKFCSQNLLRTMPTERKKKKSVAILVAPTQSKPGVLYVYDEIDDGVMSKYLRKDVGRNNLDNLTEYKVPELSTNVGL